MPFETFVHARSRPPDPKAPPHPTSHFFSDSDTLSICQKKSLTCPAPPPQSPSPPPPPNKKMFFSNPCQNSYLPRPQHPPPPPPPPPHFAKKKIVSDLDSLPFCQIKKKLSSPPPPPPPTPLKNSDMDFFFNLLPPPPPPTPPTPLPAQNIFSDSESLSNCPKYSLDFALYLWPYLIEILHICH